MRHVKCRSCGKEIPQDVVRYRTTRVDPFEIAWAGEVLGWACMECGEATEKVYKNNRKDKVRS